MKKTLLSVFPRKFLFLLVALVSLPSMAGAHTLSGGTAGIAGGFFHPLHGLDHVLAMVAVGLWAAQMGRRAIWAVPCSFVGVMALGGALGFDGVPLPFVEQGILGSVLILGLLLAAAIRLPLLSSMILVGFFAIFHGHAHGTEMAATSSVIPYAIGVLFTTALLHACGIAIALKAQKPVWIPLVRYAGIVIVAGGGFFFFH